MPWAVQALAALAALAVALVLVLVFLDLALESRLARDTMYARRVKHALSIQARPGRLLQYGFRQLQAVRAYEQLNPRSGAMLGRLVRQVQSQ